MKTRIAPIVIIESPFACDPRTGERSQAAQAENLTYLRAALRDCLLRGEAPYASHGLYTQPGVLDDLVPEERALGIDAGFAFRYAASTTVVYVDRGISAGMRQGIEHAQRMGCPIELRSLLRGLTHAAAVKAAREALGL